MKFATVAKANTAKPIVGIFFLMYLLSGCAPSVGSGGQTSKCSQAEAAVNQAQKEYDAATQKLASNPKDENASKIAATKAPNLGTLQENAYDICYRVK